MVEKLYITATEVAQSRSCPRQPNAQNVADPLKKHRSDNYPKSELKSRKLSEQQTQNGKYKTQTLLTITLPVIQ
jgi:hypothetical protein